MNGRDELASLAADFNTMLIALEESRHTQQQLIADASHERGTPLTSTRTCADRAVGSAGPPGRAAPTRTRRSRPHHRRTLHVGSADPIALPATAGLSTRARRSRSTSSWRERSSERNAGRRACGSRARPEPYRLVGAWCQLERGRQRSRATRSMEPTRRRRRDPALWTGDHGARPRASGIAELISCTSSTASTAPPRLAPCPAQGSGLAIVKQTVEDHAGSVAVANADGGGALVTLRFDAGGA